MSGLHLAFFAFELEADTMSPFEFPFVRIPLFFHLCSGQEMASCAWDARA